MNHHVRSFEDMAQRDYPDDDCSELSRGELRAGRICWSGDPKTYNTPARNEYYDRVIADAFGEKPGLLPEFWRGIMIAAGAATVFWLSGFFLLAWWVALVPAS